MSLWITKTVLFPEVLVLILKLQRPLNGHGNERTFLVVLGEEDLPLTISLQP